jgi:hypothetical protein
MDYLGEGGVFFGLRNGNYQESEENVIICNLQTLLGEECFLFVPPKIIKRKCKEQYGWRTSRKLFLKIIWN